MECTLCQSKALNPVISHVYRGQSWQCQECDLIFKNPQDHLDWEKQKQRYDFHNNKIEDLGYLQYFEKLLQPLEILLKEQNIQRGLDWGSGPEPVLKELLQKRQVKMDIFDPLYQPKEEILENQYSLITCTEVIEHFTEPKKSFAVIDSYLSQKGLFAGMTNFHEGPEHYGNWWYAKDSTHVCFYSEKTMNCLAKSMVWKVLKLESPVFIFQKE